MPVILICSLGNVVGDNEAENFTIIDDAEVNEMRVALYALDAGGEKPSFHEVDWLFGCCGVSQGFLI